MIKINNSRELAAYYQPDKLKRGRRYNHSDCKVYACHTLIEFDAWNRHCVSNEWFINDDHELIFNIGENYFINLDMFDCGESTMHNLVVYETTREARAVSTQQTLF
ncbi:hypothetical protein LROSL1_1173 [Furfurilactobacillus rossiae]|nr:hypothetical protein LROSL1_1173 [Furfurilactobacillus rossiae]